MSFEDCPRPRPTEFSMSQINGCRYLIPKREINFESFVPPSGSEVYVCKLPKDCAEMELFQFASAVGPVYDLRLMVNFTGSTRGFGFVRYYNSDTAERAISELPSKAFRLNPPFFVKIQKSTDHRSLLLVGMSTRNASSEIQNLFDRRTPGQLASVVELATEKPIYVLEFASHKLAALSKRTTDFPMHWGSTVRLMWQPNEDVENRLKQKKERELLRHVYQEGREMYLKLEDKSVTPTSVVHQPLSAQATYGVPSQPFSTIKQNNFARAPQTTPASYGQPRSMTLTPLPQSSFAGVGPMEQSYQLPSTNTPASYGQPRSMTLTPLPQSSFAGAGPMEQSYQLPSTNTPASYGQPRSMTLTPLPQSSFAGAGPMEQAYQLPSTNTPASYGQPRSMTLTPLPQSSFAGAGPMEQAYQLPSTFQAPFDQASSLPHTPLVQSLTAEKDSTQWKYFDEGDLTLLSQYFSAIDNGGNNRLILDQFGPNYPPAHDYLEIGQDTQGASTSPCATFGYCDWNQKENVPANKFVSAASSSAFSEPEYSVAAGCAFTQPGFTSESQKESFSGNKSSPSTASFSPFFEPESSAAIGSAYTQTSPTSGVMRHPYSKAIRRPIVGRVNRSSPPSPPRPLRF